MLKIRAKLENKPSYLHGYDCEIEKVIELDAKEFDAFVVYPLADQDFITEFNDLMYRDSEDAYHCLLVLGVDRPDGVLVEAEGYDYARYAAYVPQARAYIEHEAQKFADDCVNITPNDDGTISVYLEDIENFTGASVPADNCLTRIFFEALENDHRVEMVQWADVDDCISITPGQSMATQTRLCEAELRADTLGEIINAISNRIGSEVLYDILSQDCGFSNEKLTEVWFGLVDRCPPEQPEGTQDMTL